MGRGNFDVKAYTVQAKEAAKSKNSGFSATSMCDEFNPLQVKTRYSKKGPFNEFRDVITILIGLDVTGSMGVIPKSLLNGKLGSLMVDLKKTYNRPNENLQISFAGIGDGKTDKAPLQVTHFESDNRFAEQLQKIWLEEGGGGNGAESYHLLWWYAANKTHLNYVAEDKRKGILITIGDDNVHPSITASEIRTHLDKSYEGKDISNQVLLEAARAQYEIYHIIITDGRAYQYDFLKKADKSQEQKKTETQQWQQLLGVNNVINTTHDKVTDAIADIVKRHRPTQKAEMMNLSDEDWSKKNKENLTDQQWSEVLEYTLCPLTRQFMDKPVTLGDSKRAFEKQAIENYVREHQKDPLTQQKLVPAKTTFKPNVNIAQLCSDYRSFFEALPADRKARLVQLALADQIEGGHSQPVAHGNSNSSVAAIEREPVSANAAPANHPAGFFAQKPADVIPRADLVAQHGNDDDIPPRYLCPISQSLMKDPVFTEDGFTYDRSSITAWFEKHSTSPKTNLEIGKKLTPNHDLRGAIIEWQEDKARKAAQDKPASAAPSHNK